MRTADSEPSPAVSPGVRSACRSPIQPGEGSFLILKRCSKCGKSKPHLNFSPDARSRDGLQSQCKDCKRATISIWRNSNKTRALDIARRCYKKRANKARAVALVYYYKNKPARLNKILEWRRKNKKRCAGYSRVWREKNREKCRELGRNWIVKNPYGALAKCSRRRSMKKSAPGYNYTTAQHIKWRWEMWGSRCWMCGDVATASDHVIALARGGSHWPANLRPICKSCNSRKGAKKISELDLSKVPNIQCATLGRGSEQKT